MKKVYFTRRLLLTAVAALFFQGVFYSSGFARQVSGDSVVVAKSYQRLITAENKHDVTAVRAMLYNSPGTLLIAKTKTPAEGGWAGFWGTEVVGNHLEAVISSGTFQIQPDYALERISFITPDIAELYAPVKIAVSYAGQNPVPKPFLMVIIWIRVNNDWKIQSDLAIPVPQS